MEKYIFKHSLPRNVSVSSLITVYSRVALYDRPVKSESHDFPEMVFLREGSTNGHTILDGVRYPFSKGQLFIIPPNAVHGVRSKTKAVVDIISFESDSDISALYNKKAITLNASQLHAFDELIHLGVRLFEDLPSPGHQKGMSLHSRATPLLLQRFKNNLELFLIDLLLSRSDGNRFSSTGAEISSEEQFDVIVSYMKINLDKQLSLEDLAKEHSLSITKIQKLFYKYTEQAPIQYFLDLKLNAAKKMMTSTSLNHAQIAEALGFSSASYFSKLFKKKNGMSPSEYIKTLL
ncbi:MAG: helix-turn-helix domain-containing protein [Ruminococcaceae bacterium]|nr:helix-turn-helix domain-containing protein [Oscillospiraceae bacterium]